MKEEPGVRRTNRPLTGSLTAADKNQRSADPSAMEKREDAAALFVSKFTAHYRRCVSLAKRFAVDDPDIKDSAAISQLCRAAREMLEQAKEARAMTEIYLALDEKHRDAVRPVIIARFKDISKSAHDSWRRFCDSVRFVDSSKHEIQSAQSDFEPHAYEFQEILRTFIALGAKAS